MKTACNGERFQCKSLVKRSVVARFDGGDITSDGGAILLRELESKTHVIRDFSACFTDHRDPCRCEHTVEQLVGQRVYALSLGCAARAADCPERRLREGRNSLRLRWISHHGLAVVRNPG